MDWVRNNRSLVAWLAALIGVVVIVSIATRDAGPEAISVPTRGSSTVTTATTSTTTVDSIRAGVDPVNCALLLTQEERDEATGVWDREGTPASIFLNRGEVCGETLDIEEPVFVRIEPGHPDDFALGGELLGVGGEAVTGVGDLAFWFGGEQSDSSGDAGTLSVSMETELGYLYYRVSVGRPDLTSDEQLSLATDLALAALPRFPGVVLPELEPEIITLAPEDADLSGESYVDNLLAKEEAGEWSRGEGLVATLQLFDGQADRADVLRQAAVLDRSGTGVVQLARRYLDEGDDESTRSQIEALLDSLIPPLDRATAGGSATATSEASSALFALVAQPAQEEDPPEPVGPGDDLYCDALFEASAPCFGYFTHPDLEARWPGKYRVWTPNAGLETVWADEPLLSEVLGALRDSALKYEEIGTMPPTDIFLTETLKDGMTTLVVPETTTGICEVWVYPGVLDFDSRRQFLARDIAYCLLDSSIPGGRSWWTDGAATYLGGYVFGTDDLEHVNLPTRLESTELGSTLLQRTFTGWVFWERLHSSSSARGIIATLFTLDQSLAPVNAQWHPFNEDLTDVKIDDLGGHKKVPYKPPKDPVTISGPIELKNSPDAYGVRRMDVSVDSGKVACLSHRLSNVSVSWRKGSVTSPGDAWTHDLPDELSGNSAWLVTATTRSGSHTMTVDKVIDEDKECEELDASGECGLELFCDPSGYFLRVRPK